MELDSNPMCIYTRDMVSTLGALQTGRSCRAYAGGTPAQLKTSMSLLNLLSKLPDLHVVLSQKIAKSCRGCPRRQSPPIPCDSVHGQHEPLEVNSWMKYKLVSDTSFVSKAGVVSGRALWERVEILKPASSGPGADHGVAPSHQRYSTVVAIRKVRFIFLRLLSIFS